MDEIKVSIITVCYNSQKTIRNTIESVLNQTYKNIEYIIIDGASTDNTLDIINEYLLLFGGRLTVISEPDKGIYDAMNKGIKYSTGELIGIINSDDFYEVDAVEKIVHEYKGERYIILYGMVRTIENDKEKSVLLYSHNFLFERMIGHPGCFVSKNIYHEIADYNINHFSAADYEFMIKVYKSGLVTFAPVYSIISNYREGGISTTPAGLLDALKVKREYGIVSRKAYIKLFVKLKVLYFKSLFLNKH